MKALTLTNQQARRFMLAHQGLWPPYVLTGKAGLLDFVRRVGCIQFDPLNIVGRSPELMLQARIAGFRPAMLEAVLYEDRALVDGFDKNLSIYPVEDWPYFRRRREAARRYYSANSSQAMAILPQVRRAIEERGPLSSLDLDFHQTVDWHWAPTRVARAALESMYAWGELIIHHKVNTRKVYDFARCHLPESLLSAPDPNGTEEAFHDWYLLRRIGAMGLAWNRAGDAWLGMGAIKSRERAEALARLLERGQAMEIQVEGLDQPLYMRTEDRATLNRALEAADLAPRAAILAPLDNLLWDRRLVEALFGFSYIWEVYKPAAERRYGYYIVPVLYGDRFVARCEPVREKGSGALLVKGWWWEEGVSPAEEMRAALRDCLQRFQVFLGAPELRIDRQAEERAALGWLVSPA